MAFYPTLPLRVILCGDNGMRVEMTASEFKAWLAAPEPCIYCGQTEGHSRRCHVHRSTSEKDPR